MSTEIKVGFYGRVVIALDACSLRSPALEVAARLAAAGKSELVGLFIEDINLINLSALPFSREVSLRSLRTQVLEPDDIERQLKRAASEAKSKLAALAERMGVRWRFIVVRGEIAPELIAAAEKTDLLVLCDDVTVTDPKSAALGIGIVTRELAFVGAVLVGRQARIAHGGIVALIQSNGCTGPTIERAAALAIAHEQPLIVYVVSPGEDEARAIKKQCETVLAGAQRFIFRRWPDFDTPTLADSINALRPSVVLMCSGGDDVTSERRLRRLAHALDAPILFMRAED